MMTTLNPTVHFSIFNGFYDVDVKNNVECEWYDLVAILTLPHMVSANKDGKMIGPWKYKDAPAHRCAADVELVSCILLDYDKNVSLTDAKEKFVEFEHVLYTSYSHMKEGVDDHRFRIALPLATPVTPEQLIERRKAIYEWADGVDRSCLSISRTFYLPSCAAGRVEYAESWHNAGSKLFDVMAFAVEPKIEYTPSGPVEDEDKEWLISNLQTVYLGSEPRWFAVASCMATNGFTFDDFCRVTINGLMRSKSVKDCEAKWRAVNKTRSGATVGLLYNILKEHGITKPSTRASRVDDIMTKIRRVL